MIKAVIFDMDGVLVDTEYFQWQGWVEALKPYDISISKEDYFSYAGKNGEIIDEEIRKKFKLKVKKNSLVDHKESLLVQWFKKDPLKLMPYVEEAIQAFKDMGLTLAVASGSPEDELKLKLKRTQLAHHFKVISAGDQVPRGKPFPDVYLAAVKKLGLKPSECISFEDTYFGVESATSAGLTCYAVPNEFTVKQDFSKAEKVFKNLKEAIVWLENHLE